jgi:predicted transposase/invertase (TIGR01784 family)
MQKLPKDLENMPNVDEKTEQQFLWLKFIGSEIEEEVKMLAARNSSIQKAYVVLQGLSQDENVRLAYESREKAILDEQARLYGAIKEGEARGERKKAIKTAQNLLKIGLMSVEQIAQATELTEKEVQDLQNSENASNSTT